MHIIILDFSEHQQCPNPDSLANLINSILRSTMQKPVFLVNICPNLVTLTLFVRRHLLSWSYRNIPTLAWEKPEESFESLWLRSLINQRQWSKDYWNQSIIKQNCNRLFTKQQQTRACYTHHCFIFVPLMINIIIKGCRTYIKLAMLS